MTTSDQRRAAARRCRLPAAMLLTVVMMWPTLAGARLAVFVDGRVLKVDDAYLHGNRIVLILPGGGKLKVSAVRIDRVVADEVPVSEPELPLLAACDPGWCEHSLPERLPFRDLIAAAAHRANLHPALLAALVEAESDFDPLAESRAGARGLAQLMPAAAADHRVKDVFDPAENLRGGAQHLRALLDRFGSLPLALAAYNAGAATVARAGGIPPYRETQHYVRRVLTAFCPRAATEMTATPAGAS